MKKIVSVLETLAYVLFWIVITVLAAKNMTILCIKKDSLSKDIHGDFCAKHGIKKDSDGMCLECALEVGKAFTDEMRKRPPTTRL